jgi:dihydrofolate reductase
MQLIACVSSDWAIGYQGELLYNIPQDMQYFKTITTNKTVVMGRKTYESLRVKPLPHRNNIVLSSTMPPNDTILVCNDLQSLELSLSSVPPNDVFVIGGETIYSLLLDRCSTAYITKVKGSRSADTFFPLNLDTAKGWLLKECSPTYTYNGLEYSFNTYVNHD